MATIQSVKTLEICRVTPFTDSAISDAEFTLSLTYFDIACLKYLPTERVIFYQLAENNSTRSFFDSVLLPKLKHSLSLALTRFLPIVGKIIWPEDSKKPFVLYTPNDSVILIVAESNSNLNRVSQNEMQEAEALHPYIPKLPISDSKADIISFQITFFPSQGFSVGISMHHAISDAKSEAMFMKAWAHICKENIGTTTSLPLELTPVFDRTLIDDPQGLDMHYLGTWSSSSDPNPKSLKLPRARRGTRNLVRGKFELSRQDITHLRQKVVSHLDNDKDDSKHRRLSTFVVSYAYIVVAMVKATKLKREGKVALTCAADCRSRMNPPIPTNYFGNCILGSFTLIDTKGILEENGIAYVADELIKIIKELDIKVKNMSLERVSESTSKFKHTWGVVDMLIGVSGSPRFGIYETDFGWGKPIKTQVVSIDKELSISMTDSRYGNGGIEIGLALKKDEMEMFTSLFVNGLKNMFIKSAM